jgi:hypothetical protein
MSPLHQTRRDFFTSAASGLGLIALSSLLKADQSPHHPAKAKNGIFIFLIGGMSQIELFDPKPTLNKLDGKPIPDSFKTGVRLGQTNWKAPLWGSKFA